MVYLAVLIYQVVKTVKFRQLIQMPLIVDNYFHAGSIKLNYFTWQKMNC